MTIDEISSEDRPQRLRLPSMSPRRLSAGSRATAMAAATSLVLASGVATAAYRAATAAGSPDRMVPATAVAYAQIDLNLPGGQSTALDHFLDHFPGSPTNHGGASVRDRLLHAILHDSSDPHLDYDRDVRPWLGDRAAVAGWVDAAGKPEYELVLRSTDDDSARTHLRRALGPHKGLELADGYAVVAETPELARQAVAAARRSSLADHHDFSADVHALPGSPAAFGWLDGPALAKSLGKAIPSDALSMTTIPLFGFGGTTQALHGRTAVGIRVAETYAELDQRVTGGPTPSTAPSSRLTSAPDGTLAAVELGDPTSVVGPLTTMATGLLADVPMEGPARPSESGGGQCDATGTVCTFSGLQPSPLQQADPATRIKQLTGLTLPADARTLLGDAAVVTYAGIRLPGLPQVAIRTRPADLDAATTVAERLRDALAKRSPLHLAVRSAGADLVVATGADYARRVAEGGRLGADRGFALAMAGLPAEVDTAAYVDLGALVPLLVHGSSWATHLKALGVWSGVVDGARVGQIRLVVG